MRDNSSGLIGKLSRPILVASLLLIVFMTYANTVDDLDFWWHLRHGQLVYETHSVQNKDLFAHTTYGLSADSLTNSWLFQLMLYTIYKFTGFTGVGIAKSVVFVLTYLLLYLTMLKRGAGRASSFLVLCLVAFIGIDFNYTRSQLMSFFMFSCVLYVLYGFRREGKHIYLLPVLVALWANLHGGFILGVYTVLIFAFGESVKYLLKSTSVAPSFQPLPAPLIRNLVLFSLISVLASSLNPNGFNVGLFPLHFIFSGSAGEQSMVLRLIEEYQRPMLYEYHAYWFMLVLVIIFAVLMTALKRLDLTELLLVSAAAIASFKSIRFIIIFALGSGVFLAYAMTCLGGWLKGKEALSAFSEKAARLQRVSALSLIALSVLAVTGSVLSGDVLRFDMRERRYPSGAVSFLKANKIQGNMYNYYDWGGYLIWQLAPGYKVFYDGRDIGEKVFLHYSQIVNAEAGGHHEKVPLWKTLLDTYNVTFVVTRAVSPSGSLIPLSAALYEDSGWKLVYADGKSMIFLKDTDANRDILSRHALHKDKLFDEIIAECEQGIRDTPATWGYYEILGLTYMKVNRFTEALAMFEKYLSMNPRNATVRDNYYLLKQYLKR